MDVRWIEDADELETFCESLSDDPVGVDTESDHFHAYQAKVCLFQVAQGEREALIDPLALDAQELEPLFEVLRDPDIVTILHAARNDINEIDRDYGVGMNSLFDTQIAARFLEAGGNSLDWMLEELLDVQAPTGFKRFDWTTRPIPAAAQRYAITDVRYLEDLRDGFLHHLEETGWLEPFRQQCEFIAQSVTYRETEFDPEGWRSLDGADNLDGAGRAALKALYQWRHELCSDQNQSAVTLFPNGALLRLAHHRPESASGVADIDGMPTRLAREQGEAIAEVVRESQNGDYPPEKAPNSGSSGGRPSREENRRYDALRDLRNDASESLGIPPEFVATNDTLMKIAQDPPESLEELLEVREMLPWQVETFGEEILGIVKKQS
jgi:ribonuclease D